MLKLIDYSYTSPQTMNYNTQDPIQYINNIHFGNRKVTKVVVNKQTQYTYCPNNRYVVGTSKGAYWSDDLITWTACTFPEDTTHYVATISYSDGKYILVTNPYVYYSYDGKTFIKCGGNQNSITDTGAAHNGVFAAGYRGNGVYLSNNTVYCKLIEEDNLLRDLNSMAYTPVTYNNPFVWQNCLCMNLNTSNQQYFSAVSLENSYFRPMSVVSVYTYLNYNKKIYNSTSKHVVGYNTASGNPFTFYTSNPNESMTPWTQENNISAILSKDDHHIIQYNYNNTQYLAIYHPYNGIATNQFYLNKNLMSLLDNGTHLIGISADGIIYNSVIGIGYNQISTISLESGESVRCACINKEV